MLAALIAVFILSHAFRTVVADRGRPSRGRVRRLGAGARPVAGAFISPSPRAAGGRGLARPPRASARRPRRVPLALVGERSVRGANGLAVLVVGQWLIGFGCAPALLAAMVFISRRYSADRFAPISGIVLAVGGVGMLITGTPLAWVIKRGRGAPVSSRSRVCWPRLLARGLRCGRRRAGAGARPKPDAPRGATPILCRSSCSRHTAGICCLAAVSYAGFLALRGFWLGPLLAERHGFSLVEVGHVAFAVRSPD